MAEESKPSGVLSVNEIFAATIIKVKVGPNHREYYLHNPLLVQQSGFFCGALGSPAFQEAEDGVVTLADCDMSTFDGFVDILYSHAFAPEEQWTDRYGGPYYYGSRMIQWYVFADKFLIPAMKSATMDLAFQKFSQGKRVWYKDVIWAFEHLPSSDPLLQLLIDGHCDNWGGSKSDSKEPEGSVGKLPQAFWYEVMLRMQEIKKGKTKAIRPRQEYEEKKVEGEKIIA